MNICKAAALVFAISGLLCIGMTAHAARYAITNLGTLPGYEESQATCLNDKGQVAGYVTARSQLSESRKNGTNAFLWSHGRMRLLPSLPSRVSTTGEVCDAVASGINNKGQVVGTLSYFFDGAWLGVDLRAVLWEGDRLRDIPSLPNSNQNTAISINDAGQITGTADEDFVADMETSVPHIYFYSQDKSVDLGPGIATGLSEAGQVSGYVFLDAKGNPHSDEANIFGIAQVNALVCDTSGERTMLGKGYALAENASGNVIGMSESPVGPYANHPLVLRNNAADALVASIAERATFVSSLHASTTTITDPHTDAYQNAKAVLWRTGQGRSRAIPLPFHWVPQAINDKGQMVGGHWLWHDGHSDDLNRLLPAHSGWTIVQATGINNKGQIAGYGKFHGQTRAFLMTPQ